MGKVFTLIGLVILIIALPVSASPLDRPKNVDLKIVGFSVGTSMQLRAELIAEALRKEYPDWSIKALATARAAADVHKHRAEKTANFFLSLSPWPLEVEGYSAEFKKLGVDFEKVYPWFPIIPSEVKQVHFWVLNKTGLTSVKDITLKKYPLRVGLMSPGGHLPLLNRVIEFYGVTSKDIEGWGGKIVNVNFGAPVGPEMIRGGKIDAGFAWTGVPNPPFLEAADLDWRLLPLAEEPEVLRKTEEVEFGRTIIRAGTYPPVKKDIVTIGQTEWLGAIPGKVSEDVTYWVTKGLLKQREFLIAGSPAFGGVLDPKFIASALKALKNPADKGALKFYREQGWIK